jgi:endonuclease/exonuclease/phosphatase family metal-dependent hydrolase
MDFFYDGGKMVRPKKELVNKYTSGILDFLKTADSMDFMLLQEVDVNSSRTSKQNEVQIIGQELNQYSATFGYNYKVKFVPIPFFNPLGKVEMGQMNLSKASPVSSQRYSYYSAYSWPMRLFMLDRCFIVSRFQLTSGKQLVVLNTHNSAYDAGGKLREQEMPVIRDVMVKEFKKGNYVVAGGDWNQNPPDYSINNITGKFLANSVEKIDFSIFPEGWKIVNDKNSGTNRSLDFPLSIEKTKVTLIDYYIVSPNLKVEAIQTLTQNFQFSDHEPVFLRIKLN